MWKPVDSNLWRHNAQNGCSLQQQCVWKQSRPMKHLDTSVAKGKCHHNVTGVSGTQFKQCWHFVCWHSRCANVMSWDQFHPWLSISLSVSLNNKFEGIWMSTPSASVSIKSTGINQCQIKWSHTWVLYRISQLPCLLIPVTSSDKLNVTLDNLTPFLLSSSPHFLQGNTSRESRKYVIVVRCWCSSIVSVDLFFYISRHLVFTARTCLDNFTVSFARP